MSFEPQIDKENGGALGIVFIKFGTHEEAKKCVEKENGKKANGIGLGLPNAGNDGDEIRVVFDGEGDRCKAVLKELEDRKKREREEKKRKDREGKLKEKEKDGSAGVSASTSANVNSNTPRISTISAPQTPNTWRGGPLHVRGGPHGAHRGSHLAAGRTPHALPANPMTNHSFNINGQSLASSSNAGPRHIPGPHNLVHSLPENPITRVKRPPPSLVRARIASASRPTPFHASNSAFPYPSSTTLRPPIHISPINGRPIHSSHSNSNSNPNHYHPSPSNSNSNSFSNHYHSQYQASPMQMSRSPSPISRRLGSGGGDLNVGAPRQKQDLERDHEGVLAELTRNRKEHVRIEDGALLGGAVREDDVRAFFDGFKVDKVRFYTTSCLFLCSLSLSLICFRCGF